LELIRYYDIHAHTVGFMSRKPNIRSGCDIQRRLTFWAYSEPVTDIRYIPISGVTKGGGGVPLRV